MANTQERLRRARESRGLSIDDLARQTRLRAPVLQALEDGRFEELPSGLYARAVVRAYARAVGFEPQEVLAELAAVLPAAEDPLDGLARVRGIEREREPKREPPNESARIAEPAPAPARTAIALLPGTGSMALASAIDGAILAGIDIALLLASASLCGVTVPRLLTFAAPALLMLWTFFAGLYFLLLGGLGAATPGMWLAGLAAAPPDAGPVQFSAAGRRAWDVALRESSILVELLLSRPLTAVDRPAAPRFGMPAANRAADR